MKKKLQKIKSTYRKIKGKVKKGLFRKKMYLWYQEHCPIDEKAILLESQQGGALGGNIFALLKELCENEAYKEYRLYLSCTDVALKERKSFLERYGLQHRVTVVSLGRNEYFKVLATAKYLINDNTFIFVFMKRPEQVYLNTWHGTPLKTLGKKIKQDFAGIGNAQHNLLTADYLLYPNEFTKNLMIEDYMLSNLGHAKVWLTGYPRNSVFLSDNRREQIRKECGMEQMEVYAYLPTWRGVIGKVTSGQQNARLYEYLKELDTKLKDNQRVYVKLHPVSVKEIDLSAFHKVVPFPANEYDTYEFLNATDGLITDYSSVFFDYAVSRRKIILFTYDKEEYIADRGFYFSLDELPFPQVNTVDGLVECMNAEKSYDDTKFLNTFCAYEHEDITNVVLQRFLYNKSSDFIQESEIEDNGKPNIIFYLGGFGVNKITKAGVELLHSLNKEKYNFTVIFRIGDLKKYQQRLLQLPEEVAHLGYYDTRSLNVWDSFVYKLWEDWKMLPYKLARKIISKRSRYELTRILGGCRVDGVVQYTGYTNDMIAMLEEMPCKRMIFVHNDMDKEISEKKKINRELLCHAYQNYDMVVVTTPELEASTKKVAGGANEHIVVITKAEEYEKALEQLLS